MTEWNAPAYAQISGLQAAMAEEVLALLHLSGGERVLDVGCGNGKTTVKIAARVPRGSVLGVDASAQMIAFAAAHSTAQPNLQFAAADARRLTYDSEFDLVVSFNALHWIPQQELALRSIRSALKPGGAAQLRLVTKGQRKSLEEVLDETRRSSRWAPYFQTFQDPYLHLTADQYRQLAEQNGFRCQTLHLADKSWDFQSRAAFLAFAAVTFVEWTQHLPQEERLSFSSDVLDRYQPVACKAPGEENLFRFYQMDITLFAPDRRPV